MILIKTKSPVTVGVFNKIKSHPKVVEANIIYGPYEIYSLCECETTMGIKRTAMEIRNVTGVVSTLTCLISE